MIYITGDVHSPIKGHWEQKRIGSELDASKKYLDILKKHKLSATLFVNGISLDTDLPRIKKLLEYDVELGGHTYDNYGRMNKVKSAIYRKIWGCVYGPAYFQKRDIGKTREAFRKAGLKMLSWRSHAFASNEDTFKLLEKNGVRYVSDLVGEQRPFRKGNIVHAPINTPIDQNTIAYGELKPENRKPFIGCTKGRIRPQEWLNIIKKRILENEKKKVDSVLLIHPATMAVLDNFKLFKELAKFLSRFKSAKISEIKVMSRNLSIQKFKTNLKNFLM